MSKWLWLFIILERNEFLFWLKKKEIFVWKRERERRTDFIETWIMKIARSKGLKRMIVVRSFRFLRIEIEFNGNWMIVPSERARLFLFFFCSLFHSLHLWKSSMNFQAPNLAKCPKDFNWISFFFFFWKFRTKKNKMFTI